MNPAEVVIGLIDATAEKAASLNKKSARADKALKKMATNGARARVLAKNAEQIHNFLVSQGIDTKEAAMSTADALTWDWYLV